MPVTPEAIREAAGRIAGHVLETPFVPSHTLSAIAGCEVFLKFENLQFTASFKERGAFNKLSQLTAAERQGGVLAVSAGNHAQGVAYHARRLGIPATIVMPRFAAWVKVQNTRRLGAEVLLVGDSFDDARAHGLKLAQERGYTVVHPYDDEAVVTGQGTVGLEMLAQQPSIDTLVVAIGGGGLISGIAVAAKSIRPDIEVIGVQSERFPGVWNATHAEQRREAPVTIADGIGVRMPVPQALEDMRGLVDDAILVSEDSIVEAMRLIHRHAGVVSEPSGAVGVAAMLEQPEVFRNRLVGTTVCGGNLTPEQMRDWL